MLEELIGNSEKIVIMGYGEVGKILLRFIAKYGNCSQIIICDNYKGGTTVDDVSILSVSEAAAAYPDCPFIVAKLEQPEIMEQQLLELGVSPKNIYGSAIRKDIHNIWELAHTKDSTIPWDNIPFEIHLAEHCNLNCASCAHFSNLAQEDYYSLEAFQKDIARMSELLEGESGEIHLLGGEPLLNNRIIDFIKAVRDNFKCSKIGIVTNGILLNKMEPEFWNACHKYNISLMVTHYPIKINYENLMRKAECEGVEYIPFRAGGTMNSYPMDLEGKQDMAENFRYCLMGNQCILLKKGKLYTCSVVGNIEHFNKFFHKHLEVCKEDYIDIYKIQSKKELVERLATPIPFCRYCDVKKRDYGREWNVSHKDIKEWLV